MIIIFKNYDFIFKLSFIKHTENKDKSINKETHSFIYSFFSVLTTSFE